jgi:hypothetical protein
MLPPWVIIQIQKKGSITLSFLISEPAYYLHLFLFGATRLILSVVSPVSEDHAILMLVFLLTVQRGDILIWLQADGFLLDWYHGCIVGALSPKTQSKLDAVKSDEVSC